MNHWPPHVRDAYHASKTISQDAAGRWLIDGALVIPRVADAKAPTGRCPRCSSELTVDREDNEPACLFCGYRPTRAAEPETKQRGHFPSTNGMPL